MEEKTVGINLMESGKKIVNSSPLGTGRKFEPTSLHVENQDLIQTSGGVYINATKNSKPYKFQQGWRFNKAILYDIWILNTIVDVAEPEITWYDYINDESVPPPGGGKTLENRRIRSVEEFNLAIESNSLDYLTLKEFLSDTDSGISSPVHHGSLRRKAKGQSPAGNQWVHSKYFGYISSRIYLGNDNMPDDIPLNNQLTFSEESLSQFIYDEEGGNIDLNLYTLSTSAYKHLASALKAIPKTRMSKI